MSGVRATQSVVVVAVALGTNAGAEKPAPPFPGSPSCSELRCVSEGSLL